MKSILLYNGTDGKHLGTYLSRNLIVAFLLSFPFQFFAVNVVSTLAADGSGNRSFDAVGSLFSANLDQSVDVLFVYQQFQSGCLEVGCILPVTMRK